MPVPSGKEGCASRATIDLLIAASATGDCNAAPVATVGPPCRAEQGPGSRRRRDARATTKAGLRRPSRAWLLHA
jgi:hypothetical protein